MANYQGAERTNYVRIRQEKLHDVAEYVGMFNIEMHEKDGTYCFLPSAWNDDGCFSQWGEDEGGNELELDWESVARAMEDGQVLIIMSAGHEKLRYISGWAVAWDWQGNYTSLSINGIYEQAAEKFGVQTDDISRAEY